MKGCGLCSLSSVPGVTGSQDVRSRKGPKEIESDPLLYLNTVIINLISVFVWGRCNKLSVKNCQFHTPLLYWLSTFPCTFCRRAQMIHPLVSPAVFGLRAGILGWMFLALNLKVQMRRQKAVVSPGRNNSTRMGYHFININVGAPSSYLIWGITV